jgi:hypothetical protein
MTVNGYEVEPGRTGAWWVRRPGGRLAWRFATRLEAVRFAQRLSPVPPAAGPGGPGRLDRPPTARSLGSGRDAPARHTP